MQLGKNYKNLELRQRLLEGAYLAGLVQMNSGSGISAAISYPLSVYYNVPHGICGGIFIPYIIKFNTKNGFRKHDKIKPDFHHYITDLFEKVGVPKNLSNFGIYKTDINNLIEIMQTQQPAFDQNPIPFNVNSDFKFN